MYFFTKCISHNVTGKRGSPRGLGNGGKAFISVKQGNKCHFKGNCRSKTTLGNEEHKTFRNFLEGVGNQLIYFRGTRKQVAPGRAS